VLVVSRKLDESIVIGDGIEIKVLRVGREGVRLGITAAPHVSVHRGEIYNAIRRANESAAAPDTSVESLVARLRASQKKH
jgi:carbon storage regulator